MDYLSQEIGAGFLFYGTTVWKTIAKKHSDY